MELMDSRAACAEHGRFRISCQRCVALEMDRLGAEAFPADLLEPWALRVTAAQAEPIEALDAAWAPGMRSMLSGGEPTYTLKRAGEPDSTKGTRYVVEFSGSNRDDVLRCARNFDLKDV
jgi:hypothetical protein